MILYVVKIGMMQENVNVLNMEDRYYYWQCISCERVHKSDKYQRWHMESCACGLSGIDAEVHYIRGHGQTKQITEEEYTTLLTKNKEKDA